MLTFGPLTAFNERTSQPLPGTPIQVFTLDGAPVDTFTLDGAPLTLVSNARGYVGMFQADTTERVLVARARGGNDQPVYAHETLDEAADLAETVNDGRLSEAELKSTFATHERLTEVATGQTAALTDTAVAGAITAPGSTSGQAVDARVQATTPGVVGPLVQQQVPPLVANEAATLVPPLVASAIADDDTVAQAAAAAVPPAVDDYLNQHGIIPDTGWRDITSLITPTVTEGFLRIRRAGPMVELQMRTLSVSASGSATLLTLPTGFRPRTWVTFRTQPYWGSETEEIGRVGASGQVQFVGMSAENLMNLQLLYSTTDAFPAQPYPGTPY